MFLWSFVDVPLFFSVLQQTTYRIGNHVYYWVWFRPDILFFFALVLFFPFPSDQIGGGFLVCYFFPLFLFFCLCFLDVAMVWNGKPASVTTGSRDRTYVRK